MTRPIPMARFDLAWPLAGACAAVLSVLTLGALSAAGGLPFWAPLNATTHVLHGPEAAATPAFDLSHTGLGAVIHVGSCFFWAAVAVMLVRRARRGGAGLAWGAGLGTALVAGLVDYVIMPVRLRPGWELVLSPVGVAAGFAALGVGLSLGLIAAEAMGNPEPETAVPQRRYPDPPAEEPAEPSPLDRLRHPAPNVLDQRQQRMDPANALTEDPNRHATSSKQPGDPHQREGPDR